MPESKKSVKDLTTPVKPQRAGRARSGSSGAWVPWAFCTLGLLGVAWLVVFYVAGYQIPGMRELGNWNILVAMGLIGSAFVVSTHWK